MGMVTYPSNPFPPSSDDKGGASPYVLPVATAETLGGVKIGDGLAIDETGTLSTSGGEITILSTTPFTGGPIAGFSYVLGTVTPTKSGKYTLVMHNRPSNQYSGPRIGTSEWDTNPVISTGLVVEMQAGTTYKIFHGENTGDVNYSNFYVEFFGMV